MKFTRKLKTNNQYLHRALGGLTTIVPYPTRKENPAWQPVRVWIACGGGPYGGGGDAGRVVEAFRAVMPLLHGEAQGRAERLLARAQPVALPVRKLALLARLVVKKAIRMRILDHHLGAGRTLAKLVAPLLGVSVRTL